MAEPYTMGEQKLIVTACIGIAIRRAKDAGADQIIKEAYYAMIKAKQYGSGEILIYEHIKDQDILMTPSLLEKEIKKRRLQIRNLSSIFNRSFI